MRNVVVSRLSVDSQRNQHGGQEFLHGPDMVSQASSLSRRTRQKVGMSGIGPHLQAQCLEGTREIVERVLPTARGFKEAKLL